MPSARCIQDQPQSPLTTRLVPSQPLQVPSDRVTLLRGNQTQINAVIDTGTSQRNRRKRDLHLRIESTTTSPELIGLDDEVLDS